MIDHPELGYFDEGFDLTEPKLYAPATKPFGRAQVLPPTAYRSKVFADLEDEKVWTRDWVCIGHQQQIPDPGDLLPFTVGNHGIHVQRCLDGRLIGRFNKAQHGGCRFIPAQCQTGTKTKCSFTSCGYSRDRDVIRAAEVADDLREAGQYLGDRPERLLPVKVETWGPFIFVNLDHESDSLEADIKGLAKRIGPHADRELRAVEHSWSEHACNWKLAGRALLEDLALPFAAEVRPDGTTKAISTRAAKPRFALVRYSFAKDYAARFAALPEIAGLKPSQRGRAELCWLFPNLLLALLPNHLLSVILQPTATALTRLRMSLFVNASAKRSKAVEADNAALAALWREALDHSIAHAEARQRDLGAWGTPARPETAKKRPPKEDSCHGYDFQKYLVECILAEHTYYWAAPLYSQPGR